MPGQASPGHRATLSDMASSSAFPRLRRGWASDLEVLAVTGSEVSDRGDHLVVRTPGNPDFRWGNLLVVRDPRPPQRRRPLGATGSRAELPAAGHRSIGLPAAPDPAPWTALGLRVESDEVLTAPRPPRAGPPAEGYDGAQTGHGRRLGGGGRAGDRRRDRRRQRTGGAERTEAAGAGLPAVRRAALGGPSRSERPGRPGLLRRLPGRCPGGAPRHRALLGPRALPVRADSPGAIADAGWRRTCSPWPGPGEPTRAPRRG